MAERHALYRGIGPHNDVFGKCRCGWEAKAPVHEELDEEYAQHLKDALEAKEAASD